MKDIPNCVWEMKLINNILKPVLKSFRRESSQFHLLDAKHPDIR